MRWDEASVKRLEDLINENKRPDEISALLGISRKSLSMKMGRLGLRIRYKEFVKCKECGVDFEALTNSGAKFCTRSCSVSSNNKNKIKSEETKEKIRSSVHKYLDSIPKKRDTKKVKRCRYCSEVINDKYKRICTTCKNQYYVVYRAVCKFDFNVYDYPDKFNLDLIDRFGWYLPSNRGNNIDGVSRDHMFSVRDGFRLGILPEIVKHPANCNLMLHKDNNVKKTKSSITITQLLERIKNWEY
jgi:hypothetical protein